VTKQAIKIRNKAEQCWRAGLRRESGRRARLFTGWDMNPAASTMAIMLAT
jgi:hypothetical protein